METVDTLIIGAGISGLLCATELQRAGLSVCVLDKGRGVGGRMATRQMANGRLDHGAQYFTVRDPRFQAFVDEWQAAGIVREWFRKIPEDTNPEGYPRYCGVNGMTDVAKHLASQLEVHRSQQVIDLVRCDGAWIAQTSAGRIFAGSQLVVTTPLPQALSLLATTGLQWAGAALPSLEKIRYRKGLAALLVLEGPSGLPAPGGLKLKEGPLTWIADNQQKGISPDVSTVTLHADSDFAERYWDASDEVRGVLMIEAARPYLRSSVREFTCHRWGYTLPVTHWPEPYFENSGLKLVLAGDAFGGPRVEGAALSGIAAAQNILNRSGSLKMAL